MLWVVPSSSRFSQLRASPSTSFVTTNFRSFVFRPSFTIRSTSATFVHLSFTFSFAVPRMVRTKITANPPPSSRDPPSQTHNPPRAPGAFSSQAERPATPRPNPAQAAPPDAGGASNASLDYKKLYPWATSTLLRETSSVNSAGAVLRLKKGDEPNLSFHKEHDDKLTVLPCPPRCAGLRR